MKWKCEVSDIISEMQDQNDNTITDINLLLIDALTGEGKYHRVSVEVPIGTFTGKSQKDVCFQIDALTNDIFPLPMFIGKPNFKWSKTN